MRGSKQVLMNHPVLKTNVSYGMHSHGGQSEKYRPHDTKWLQLSLPWQGRLITQCLRSLQGVDENVECGKYL